MQSIAENSAKKIQEAPMRFKRFLMNEINWERRLIAVKGARGSGKTSLLLQYLKEYPAEKDEILYASLDHMYFTEHPLLDFADDFVKTGGKILALDEVHKYPSWSREIKNIYDNYSGLKIIFTGSSILEIDKADADLSRRAVVYNLPTLSLREYIELKSDIKSETYTLDDILKHHRDISLELTQKIKPIKEFKAYRKQGAYPYFIESGADFLQHLERTVGLILETDLPAFTAIDFQSIYKLKQLLMILAESVPFKPNITNLNKRSGIGRDTIIRYFNYLERAGLIRMLGSSAKGMSLMSKPEKIYMENPNLIYALQAQNANVGNVRETFFYNQLSHAHQLSYPQKGDFLIDGSYLIEVGGKNKTQKQIAGQENSFIAADDIEHGFRNQIPLWMFGFLY